MKVWLSAEAEKFYRNTDEQETMPDDGWLKKVLASDLKLKSLKEWYQEELADNCPRLERGDAANLVNQILPYANITSSSSDPEVIIAAIKRRC
jgi:hypothetical protein